MPRKDPTAPRMINPWEAMIPASPKREKPKKQKRGGKYPWRGTIATDSENVA